MAIDFNRKIMVTNPTLYGLGMGIVGLGMISIITGLASEYSGEELLLPVRAWCVFGIPVVIVGAIVLLCGLRKS